MNKVNERMKDSGVEWIGEIPERWGVVPAHVYLKETKHKNVGMQEENVLSLSYGNIITKNVAENMGLIPASYETYQIVERGQIIFRLTDLQNDKKSLRNGLVRERGIITSAYTAVQAMKDCIPAYFNYLFRAYDTTKVLYTLGSGVRQSSDYNELKRLPMVVPPTETQQKIVDFLDVKTAQVDAVIEKKKRMIELLKEKRTSIITHAVTKGLDPNAKMKDSGVEWIGEIPVGWEVRRAMFLYKQVSRKPLDEDEIITAFRDGQVTLRKNRREDGFTNALVEAGYQHIEPGDLVIHGMDGFAGAIGVSDSRGKSSPVYSVCVPTHKFKSDPRYHSYLLRHMAGSGFILAQARGIRERSTEFRFKEFRKNFLLIPTYGEQGEIADFLDQAGMQIKKSIDAIETQVEKLHEYRNSLIYHAVTGKISV